MGRVVADAEQAETDFLIYTSNFCNYCTAVKRLLGSKELTFTEINFSNSDRELRMEVVEETGHRTVPVVIDLRGEQPMFIGGFDETSRYLKK